MDYTLGPCSVCIRQLIRVSTSQFHHWSYLQLLKSQISDYFDGDVINYIFMLSVDANMSLKGLVHGARWKSPLLSCLSREDGEF